MSIPQHHSQRVPTRRGALVVTAGMACLALASSGCKSAVDDAGSSGRKQGGTLNIAQSADIAPNTFLSQNNPNFSVIRTVFNTLTEYDHTTLKPQPQLATSWKWSPDHKSITLQLRDGVTFHSGRPFTADDVIFTIKAITRQDVPSQFKHVAQAITSMKADGAHTLTLRMAQPVSNLFDLFEVMPIVDKATFDDLLAGKKFVGTGPFKVVKYTPGSGLQLKRNDHYWKSGRPYLDKVNISVQSQSQSMKASLRSGQSQLALDLAPLDTVSLKGDPNFKVVASDAADAAYYIGSNVTVPPLNKPQFRQAVAWAVDRDRILKQVLAGIGQTSSLPWSPSSPAFDKDKADTYHHDLGKAKQLIAQAGAKNAAVNIVFNSGLPTNQAIAEIVQFDLKQAGLRAKLVPLQAADFFGKLSGGGLPGLFVNVHGFGQLNPATLVKGAFPFNAEKNASNFDSGTYRTLAQQVWTTPGGSKAHAAYAKMNDFLLKQEFVNDLVVSSHTFTISTKLKDLKYNLYDYLDLDDAYLTK
ncbi:ABC transporter substrate-binding protein [Streptomyces sp. NPDC048419]|uniref:ABC transporter substrate-binding protein n=1 Tax=Streptomyces sp. NPDC048419 TaxID=3365547 RepID=UPI0037195E50